MRVWTASRTSIHDRSGITLNEHSNRFSELAGGHKALISAVVGLAIVALGISGYLSWVTLQQSGVAGCTGGALVDCDEVLSSSWSKWLGVPVSVLGAVVYLGILGLSVPVAAGARRWVATALFTLTLTAAGAAVWFISTQVFLLHHLCFYCLATHICGLVICGLTFYFLQATANRDHLEQMGAMFGVRDAVPQSVPGEFHPLVASGIASAGLLVLIVGQVFFPPSGMEFVASIPADVDTAPQTQAQPTIESGSQTTSPERQEDHETEPAVSEKSESAVSETEVPVAEEPEQNEPSGFDESLFNLSSDEAETGSSLTNQAGSTSKRGPRVIHYSVLDKPIKATDEPALGNIYADQVLVELLDYTCPHCRRMHPFIRKALERYGDQLGIVIYHVPLSRHCNPYVKFDQSLHSSSCDYAKLAISVWKVAPKRFAEFHNWLMEGDKPPPLYEAKRRARALAGDEVLLDKSLGVDANRRVAVHVEEMKQLNSGLPIVVSTMGFIRGVPKSEAEWFNFFDKELQLAAQTQ